MTTAPTPSSGSVPATTDTPPPETGPRYQHDVLRQARLLRDALQSDKIRIGCFLGAGCPSGIYDQDGKRTKPLIPDVARLTSDVRAELEASDAGKGTDDKLAPSWDKLSRACKDGGEESPNIEHILSELRTLTARRGTGEVDGLSKDTLEILDRKVCDLVVSAVGKPLPSYRCSYHRLASWVGGLQRTAPIDLFTPNYDLLIEEAFECQRMPHFDGFVGSREPFFDIASIEQDALPRRWARLWKLHGSINWQRREDGAVFRAQGPAAEGKAMIYPSHLKYDQSRRMPYLAMIDRLRAFFRPTAAAPVFGPPVLVVCGYSFSDDHLNEVLLDGLRGNQAAQCFVLAYGSLAESETVVKFASEQPNMTVLACDGAVVGTRAAAYASLHSDAGESDVWIQGESGDRTAATGSTESVRCRLGDFHYFTLFLEQLYSDRSEVEHAAL